MEKAQFWPLRRFISFTLYLLSLLGVSSASAEVFPASSDRQNYDPSVQALKVGSELEFSNQESFEILEIKRSGYTTFIAKVNRKRDGKIGALRMPLRSGDFYYSYNGESSVETTSVRSIRTYAHFLNLTLRDYQKMIDAEVPVPELYDSLKDTYIFVEYVEHLETLEEFLFRFSRGGSFSEMDQRALLAPIFLGSFCSAREFS